MMQSLLDRRGLGGELIAEFLGTMVLILFGDGVVGAVLLFLGFGTSSGSANTASWILINFGWGFAVMLGIYVAGTLTGAHINPAVTLAFALRRAFPWAKVIPYWIAQVLGAFVAAAILFVEYSTGFEAVERTQNIQRGSLASIATSQVFFTVPHTSLGGAVVPIQTAFFDEVLGTALLVGLILAIVDTRNAPVQSNLAPFIIGMLIVAIGMSFGVVSGYAINPARDFGPRVFAFFAGWGQVAFPGNGPGFSWYFWVPIVAPLIGAAIGAYIYDYGIHSLLEMRAAPEMGVEEQGRTVVETADRAPSATRTDGRAVTSEGRMVTDERGRSAGGRPEAPA